MVKVYNKNKKNQIKSFLQQAPAAFKDKPKQIRYLPDVTPDSYFMNNPYKVLKRWRPLSRALLDKLLNWMFNLPYTYFSQETIAEYLDAER